MTLVNVCDTFTFPNERGMLTRPTGTDFRVARALRVPVERLPEKLLSMKGAGTFRQLSARLRDHPRLQEAGLAPSPAWLCERVKQARQAAAQATARAVERTPAA